MKNEQLQVLGIGW